MSQVRSQRSEHRQYCDHDCKQQATGCLCGSTAAAQHGQEEQQRWIPASWISLYGP